MSRAAGASRQGASSTAFGEAAVRDGGEQQRLLEIQRSRLLAGAVGAIEQFGYAQATVAQITARARVSRRTFYEIFDDREECLTGLVDEALRSVEAEIAARPEGLLWCERVRHGLRAILEFCDRERALACVCVMHGLRAGPRVQERRVEILARLAAALDEARSSGRRAAECPPLTAEGLVGAASSIVQARLMGPEREPLVDLTGELMGLIVLPYLGPAAARRERAQPAPPADRPMERAQSRLPSDEDPLRGVPMRLTYRTARVLLCIAEQPEISNRWVADRAGIADQGQVSKLLARLERLELTVNVGVGHARGEANAWKLTELGEQVAERLRLGDTKPGRRAA